MSRGKFSQTNDDKKKSSANSQGNLKNEIQFVLSQNAIRQKKIVLLTFKFAPIPRSTDLLFSSLSPRDKIMPIPSFGLRLKTGETCQKEKTNQSTVEMEVETLAWLRLGSLF